MERDPSASPAAAAAAPSTSGSAGIPKLIEWEDYEQEAARLWSLTSALDGANAKKLSLESKLRSLIDVEAESLNRQNVLDEMREKLEARKAEMDRMTTKSKVVAEEVKKVEDSLSAEVRSLLVAGTALSVASKRLQESNRSLAGHGGYALLKNMLKMLRLRQQSMTSQVSLLYPVKMVARPSEEQELESFPSSSRSGYYIGSKPVNEGSLTILGLHLTLLPFTKMSFFTDKKAIQRSATALGYVAHDLEQLLNYIGVKSLGPRNVLVNLKELIRTIQSAEFLET